VAVEELCTVADSRGRGGTGSDADVTCFFSSCEVLGPVGGCCEGDNIVGHSERLYELRQRMSAAIERSSESIRGNDIDRRAGEGLRPTDVR